MIAIAIALANDDDVVDDAAADDASTRRRPFASFSSDPHTINPVFHPAPTVH